MNHRFVASTLGLLGFDLLALSLVVALILDGSVLLVGNHGAGKTTLGRRLARALGLTFRLYDASKTPFEEVLGFIDPSSLAEGAARYVPTPLSAIGAGFIFIDELSRADPSMQSRFLELVFERTLMGEPLPGLHHVFAGMNPPTYLGAGEVDEALLGRFDQFVAVPTFCSMSPTDQRAAVQTMLALQDGPGAMPGPAGRVPDPSHLQGFILAARAELEAVREACGAQVNSYVLALVRVLHSEGVELDARRVGMIQRNLLGAHAAVAAGWEGADDDDARYCAIVQTSLPLVASDPDLDLGRIQSWHSIAWGTATAADGLGVIDVLGDGDPGRALDRYLEVAATLSVPDHDRAVGHFQEALQKAPYKRRVPPALRLLKLLRALQGDRASDFPPELVARLLTWGRRLLGLDHDQSEALRELAVEAGGTLDLRDPQQALLARFALRLSAPQPDDPDQPPAPAQAARILERLRAGLDLHA